MSITIKPITDHENYDVNGKEVYKDTNGNWINKGDLSDAENRAFRTYKKQVIENTRFKKHTKATYKG
jgi:phage terminase large subunit